MSYPFDQMTSLVSANQKLGQALFEVARVAAQRQAKLRPKVLRYLRRQVPHRRCPRFNSHCCRNGRKLLWR